MPTGDIAKCELETGHAEVEGRSACLCGYRKYLCRSCGEKEFHKDDCSELLARRAAAPSEERQRR